LPFFLKAASMLDWMVMGFMVTGSWLLVTGGLYLSCPCWKVSQK